MLHDNGVEHDLILPVIVKDDDALVDADHVGGHAYAALPVGGQRVQQILCRVEILRCGGLGLLGQKCLVLTDITDHMSSSRMVFFFGAQPTLYAIMIPLPKGKSNLPGGDHGGFLLGGTNPCRRTVLLL